MYLEGKFSPAAYYGAIAIGFGVGYITTAGAGSAAGAAIGAELYQQWAGSADITVDKKNIRNIGHIYLNLKKLKGIYFEQRFNGEGELNDDFNLHDYIKKIWDDVSAAGGNKHNFMIHNDLERPNVLRIIDANFQKDEELTPDKIHELKIQSNDTICRDFSYNSVIPNELSATIGVAMQNPDSIQDLDGATFAAMAKGIRSRFHVPPTKEKTEPSDEEKQKAKEEFKELLDRIYQTYVDLCGFQGMILKGSYSNVDEFTGQNEDQSMVGQARVELKGFFNAINKFHTIHHKDGTYDKKTDDGYPVPLSLQGEDYYQGFPKKVHAPSPVSSVIPLKFNAKLDGIGGITIGNLFRVDPTRLPKAYKQSDIGFVCMGEQQSITAGQDWTTDIHGQLVLLTKPTKTDTSTVNVTNVAVKNIASDRTEENIYNPALINIVTQEPDALYVATTNTGMPPDFIPPVIKIDDPSKSKEANQLDEIDNSVGSEDIPSTDSRTQGTSFEEDKALYEARIEFSRKNGVEFKGIATSIDLNVATKKAENNAREEILKGNILKYREKYVGEYKDMGPPINFSNFTLVNREITETEVDGVTNYTVTDTYKFYPDPGPAQ